MKEQQTEIKPTLPPCDECAAAAGEQCRPECPRAAAQPAARKCGTCDAKPGEPCAEGCRAWLARLFDQCTAALPWARGICSNPATGDDGACDECRAELAELDEWSEAGLMSRCAHLTYGRVQGARCHCYTCGRAFNRTPAESTAHRARVARVTLALFRRMARRNRARGAA